MAKLVKFTLTTILVLMLFVAFFRHLITRTLIEKTVTAATGLELSIEHSNLNVLKGSLYLQGISLLNPPGFKDQYLARVKEILIKYDLLGSFGGRLHFPLLKIDISEINIIKNEKNVSNLSGFKKKKAPLEAAKAPYSTQVMPSQKKNRPEKKVKPKLLIDRLELSLGKVTFMNYQAKIGEPAVIIVTIKDPSIFTNVTDLRHIVNSVVYKEIIGHILPRAE